MAAPQTMPASRPRPRDGQAGIRPRAYPATMVTSWKASGTTRRSLLSGTRRSRRLQPSGVDEVVTRAGYTKPSLYRAFGSKEGLIGAYLQLREAELWRGWDEAAARHPHDPRAQLMDWLGGLSRPGPRGCGLSNAAVEFPEAGHPARLAAEAAKAELRRRLHDLARRIEGRLVAIGVQAYLSTPYVGDLAADEERAVFANRTGADLFVSLAVDASTNADACRVSTYYFGAAHHGTVSTAGERLAGLVHREVVARTDLVDLRSHAQSWDLLRRTRMPAVRADIGYLTNSGDRRRLEDPGFRDALAEAHVVAIQRFYLSPEVDAHTGTMRLSELREGVVGLGAQLGQTAD